MGYQRSIPWALIVGAALLALMILGPFVLTIDRSEMTKTIVESKGTALSYITSWGSGDTKEDGGDEMEIGDDDDIDYDDYKDIPAKEPPAKQDRGNDASISPPPIEKVANKTFLEALKSCKDMVCVREAHKLPKKEAKFNFPHFLIIGFQKAATTSLHVHLGKHEEALRPAHKEPEFFTIDCKGNPPDDCSKEDSEKYVKETLKLDEFIASRGSKAAFESSTHVVRKGEAMAPALYKLVPWTKIVVNVREPISRAASMLIHMKDVYKEGCLAEKDLGYCLHARSQIRGLRDGTTSYYDALALWFTHWPAEQILVVQYEELTDSETEDKVMKEVKKHIGLDPSLPKASLTVINDRRFRIQPEGWPMSKAQYKKLLKLVEPDVDAMLDLLEVHGKVKDRKAFKKRWEAVWEANLATCDEKDQCTINLS